MSDSDENARTLFCSNLSENVTDAMLYELFLQGGPVERISIPKKEGRQCSFGFITYTHLCSIPYALELFTGTRLFDREITLKSRQSNNNENRPQQQNNQYNDQNNDRHLDDPAPSPPPVGNPFNQTASLRSGFHDAPRMHNDMRPSDNGRQHQHHFEAAPLDYNALLQMGAQMMMPGYSGNHANDESNRNSNNLQRPYDYRDNLRKNRSPNSAPYSNNHHHNQKYDVQRSHNSRSNRSHHQRDRSQQGRSSSRR